MNEDLQDYRQTNSWSYTRSAPAFNSTRGPLNGPLNGWDAVPKFSAQPQIAPPAITEEKASIYRAIANYFGDITLTKGFDSSPDRLGKSYSFYYAKPGCLMCIEDRYIVAITMNDGLPPGNIEKLSNLEWMSFQTRTLESSPINGLKTVSYSPVEDRVFLQDGVKLLRKGGGKWIYEPNIAPVIVELLDKDGEERYSDRGTIKTCLDTYNCVISFII